MADKNNNGNFFLSEPSRLVDTADYQEGSVVSRTIVKGTSGTVTFFAFDKGQELSEHTAPFDALVIVLEGEAQIKVSGTPHNVKQAEALKMPANEPHSVKALGRFKMLLVMITSG